MRRILWRGLAELIRATVKVVRAVDRVQQHFHVLIGCHDRLDRLTGAAAYLVEEGAIGRPFGDKTDTAIAGREGHDALLAIPRIVDAIADRVIERGAGRIEPLDRLLVSDRRGDMIGACIPEPDQRFAKFRPRLALFRQAHPQPGGADRPGPEEQLT